MKTFLLIVLASSLSFADLRMNPSTGQYEYVPDVNPNYQYQPVKQWNEPAVRWYTDQTPVYQAPVYQPPVYKSYNPEPMTFDQYPVEQQRQILRMILERNQ